MRLVVLGSGTCVPSGERASAGYWLEAGPWRLRLDCGAGTVHAMARWGLAWEALTHQVITHFHLDHVGELPGLLFTMKHGRAAPRTAPLALVGPVGLRALVEDAAAAFRSRLFEQEFPIEIHELAPEGALPLDADTRLLVAKTPHTAESLAVRVEHRGRAVGYTGDTAPSDALAAFFRDVDLLVAECSFLDEARATPHLTADDVADLAAAARARHLLATHFYFDPDAAGLAERLARRYGGRITIARDGTIVDVEG